VRSAKARSSRSSFLWKNRLHRFLRRVGLLGLCRAWTRQLQSA